VICWCIPISSFFLTYWCISTSSVFKIHDVIVLMMPLCLRFHNGVVLMMPLCLRFHVCVLLMMPLCLEYHLLGFHQLSPKLDMTPRPLNIGKSYIFVAFMGSLKPILLYSSKNRQKNSKKGNYLRICRCTPISRFFWHIDVYRQALFLGFTMPLLWWPKIGWEKNVMCLRGSPKDLSLFPASNQS